MKNEELEGDWSAYAEYNKLLRAWFVAFGIGVPASFLINSDKLGKYLSAQEVDLNILVIFLIGAAAQVLMAFINKIINWCAYYKLEKFPKRNPANRWEKIADLIAKASDWFLIDVVSDLITIGCFSYSIYKLIHLVFKAYGK